MDDGQTGKRLDQALHERFAEFSRSRLQDWIKSGRVLVNEAPARASRVLREGDTVNVEPAGTHSTSRGTGSYPAAGAVRRC